MDLLIEIASYDLPIVESLKVMCAKSLLLSFRLQERHIKSIFENSRGRSAYYQLLRELIKPNGKIVRKLQDSTVRVLVEDRGRYIPDAVPASDQDRAQLENYAELMSLLARCSEDDNTFALSVSS